MKQKQLSMKKLYMLAQDYLVRKISQPLNDTEADVLKRKEIITEYLDYIWKHKKDI